MKRIELFPYNSLKKTGVLLVGILCVLAGLFVLVKNYLDNVEESWLSKLSYATQIIFGFSIIYSIRDLKKYDQYHINWDTQQLYILLQK